jgi:hypothetical protein
MSRIVRLLPLLFVTLCGSGLASAPASAAEGWKEARKVFRAAMKLEDWKARRDAYADLAYHDGPDAVAEVIKRFSEERNPAVTMTGIETLAAFRSKEATAAIEKAVRKGRGMARLYVLLAVVGSKGGADPGLLRELLAGKDPMAAAQAAIALGQQKAEGVKPILLDLTKHKDWQLRAAAARGLAGLGDKSAVPALVASLAASDGGERHAILSALHTLTGQTYGLDLAAWRQLAAGTAPSEIKVRIPKGPYAFQIPILGKRVVLIVTNSQRNEDPHRFGAGPRLEELCEVPGARPLLHTRLVTVGTFIRAHITRCIDDLSSNQKFELILFTSTVSPQFGKFVPANSGTKKVAAASIDGLVPAAGMNHYDALRAALDLGGSKDKQAWKNGPDEILFTACNAPNAGEIKEAPVVAAAIGLHARLRMVPVHTVGVESHSYEMMETIAAQSGGIYRKLYE